MKTPNSPVAGRSSQLGVVGIMLLSALLLASEPSFALSFFDFSNTTIVEDAKALLTEAATIAVGIGMAAVAFFVGVAALRWLRSAA